MPTRPIPPWADQGSSALNKVRTHAPLVPLKSRPDFPAIAISPQRLDNENWIASKLNAPQEDIPTRYRVDRSRICLTRFPAKEATDLGP